MSIQRVLHAQQKQEKQEERKEERKRRIEAEKQAKKDAEEKEATERKRDLARQAAVAKLRRKLLPSLKKRGLTWGMALSVMAGVGGVDELRRASTDPVGWVDELAIIIEKRMDAEEGNKRGELKEKGGEEEEEKGEEEDWAGGGGGGGSSRMSAAERQWLVVNLEEAPSPADVWMRTRSAPRSCFSFIFILCMITVAAVTNAIIQFQVFYSDYIFNTDIFCYTNSSDASSTYPAMQQCSWVQGYYSACCGIAAPMQLLTAVWTFIVIKYAPDEDVSPLWNTSVLVYWRQALQYFNRSPKMRSSPFVQVATWICMRVRTESKVQCNLRFMQPYLQSISCTSDISCVFSAHRPASSRIC
jgi:hypothetical protein